MSTSGPGGGIAPPPVPPSERPSRPWWRVLGSIAAVGVLLISVVQIIGTIGRTTETERRTLEVTGITRLVVDSHDGNVEVTGSERDDIRLVARVEHGLWRTRLRIERDGDTWRASSNCPPFPGHCGVDYTIEVPRDLRVVARSGNGDVSARDLAAAAELFSANGNVRAANLSGDARLESRNGDVSGTALLGEVVEATSRNGDVSVDHASPPEHVVARSSNGDVEVAVPDDGEPYALDMETANGSRTGDIRTDPDSGRRLRIHSRNGDVTVRYRLR